MLAAPRLKPPEGFRLDRRRFLESSLGALGAYAALFGGTSWPVAPDKAWAVELVALEPELAKTLLHMTRALYPHEFLGDLFYAKVVKDLDVEASGRWSTDFVHDQLACGRRFRVLTIIDDVTKECLAAVPDTSLTGKRVVREFTALIERRGRPDGIVSDNGTEFTSSAVLAFTQAAKLVERDQPLSVQHTQQLGEEVIERRPVGDPEVGSVALTAAMGRLLG